MQEGSGAGKVESFKAFAFRPERFSPCQANPALVEDCLPERVRRESQCSEIQLGNIATSGSDKCHLWQVRHQISIHKIQIGLEVAVQVYKPFLSLLIRSRCRRDAENVGRKIEIHADPHTLQTIPLFPVRYNADGISQPLKVKCFRRRG